MTRFPYMFFLLAIFALHACKKEKDQLNDVCIPLSEQRAKFPPPGPSFGFGDTFHASGSCVGILDVNPFNGDEFLMAGHVKLESDGKYHGLYRYNLKTGERIELPLEVYLTSGIRWSRKDWLLFTAQSGHQSWDAYKMKSNGDSLTRLTFSGNAHYPEWNWEGDKFLCFMGLTAYDIIFDAHGTILDTIPNTYSHSRSWRHDSLLALSLKENLKVKDLKTGNIVFQVTIDDIKEFTHSGCEWVDHETIIWTNARGMFRSNINTGQTIQIISSCDAILYGGLKYSFGTGRLICSRTVRKMTSGDKGTQSSRFVTIDPWDGAMEFLEVEGCE
jgi:hypothetical protein